MASSAPAAEIITLQFGHFANHVGAHVWNAQELSFRYGEDEQVCVVLLCVVKSS